MRDQVNQDRLLALGINEKIDKPAVFAAILRVAQEAGVAETGCPKEVGVLLYNLASSPKTKTLPDSHRAALAALIGARKVTCKEQYDSAVAYVAANTTFDSVALEEAAGVGVEVSDEELKEAIALMMQEQKAEIMETRYRTNVAFLRTKLLTGPHRARLKFVDGRTLKSALDAGLEELLGPRTEEDVNPKATSKGKVSNKPKDVDADAEAEAKVDQAGLSADRRLPRPEENVGEAPYGVNSKEQLEAHLKATGGKVITRFPPEPNGYLHIGHAKAMLMNFSFAARAGGQTILRYDDTNPEAEEEEYFEMIEQEVRWLGHCYSQRTYSSSYFGKLHKLAVQLIKSGDAYVCHQSAEEVKASRALLVDAHHKQPLVIPDGSMSPWRDRSVAENLRWFERMRQGRCAEGEAFLRFKGDLTSPNPNMWDLAAYRVKFQPHPAAGSGWCIYPTYDFTHCVIDSLENVTHSLCTLEFETRQAPDGSYYWLLDRLGMYKPATWEYARLNITYNVLSKRKLNYLVKSAIVSGWDDPRLLTLAGLRRAGYSPSAINKFCSQIGVARADGTWTQVELLESVVRSELDAVAPRLMVVLRPLRVRFTNFTAPVNLEVPNHPKVESMGKRALRLGDTIFIDRSDFRLVDDPGYYGLAPGKEVGLKHAGLYMRCTDVIKGEDGEVKELCATLDLSGIARAKKDQPKGVLQWVPADTSIALAEVRLYDHLFTVPNVGAEDDWLACVNHKSLERVHGAKGEQAVGDCKVGWRMQFERLGYFVCDKDSGPDGLVFNRTVSLAMKPKDKAAVHSGRREVVIRHQNYVGLVSDV